MPYVITSACTKDGFCKDVCTVDAISTNEDSEQYFIDPDQCIDCGSCSDECPVGAIFQQDDVPGAEKAAIAANAAFYS